MSATNEGTYLQSMYLNWFKGTAVHAAPSNTYLALFTTQPANDGTGGTEVSGGAYARATMAGSSAWAGPSSSNPTKTNNAAAVNFPTATANWGTIVAMGIYDASSAGNLLYVAALTANVTINSGDIFQFAIGAVVVTEGGGALPTAVQTARIQWLRSFSYYAVLTTHYLALFTTAPALDGTGGTEVSGGSYVRYALTASTGWGSLSGASPTALSNAGTISFTQATANWGTVVAVGMYSATSGGTFHALWTLTSSVNVLSGHIFTISAGGLTLSQD